MLVEPPADWIVHETQVPMGPRLEAVGGRRGQRRVPVPKRPPPGGAQSEKEGKQTEAR